MYDFLGASRKNLKYAFKSSKKLNDKQKKYKRSGIMLIIGFVLAFVQLITTFLFIINVLSFNILPAKYVILLNLVLIVLWIYSLLSQFTKTNLIGKILAIVLSIVLVYGSLVIGKLNSTLDNLNKNANKVVTVVDVVVLKDDPVTDMMDALAYPFGVNSSLTTDTLKEGIEMLQKSYNTVFDINKYTTWESLFNALNENTDVKAIIMEDSTRESMKEIHEDFYNNTRVLASVDVTKEVEIKVSNKNVETDAFVIYISGNDGTGALATVGNSDVNILAVVNPKTRQILMVTTPRDYYIPIFTEVGERMEKLTHAGCRNSGLQNSADTLSKLYGIDIDYLFKVNFDGCVGIVDALGGITINSEVDFTNGDDAAPINYHFNVGPNECDGAKTLAFCRERQIFGLGDIQRGKNQVAAIKGIFAKAITPAILTKYDQVLDAVGDMLMTTMPGDVISTLVKAQLSDTREWNIQSYSAGHTGTGSAYLEYYDTYNSVVFPDMDSVATASDLMRRVMKGEIIDVDAITGN